MTWGAHKADVRIAAKNSLTMRAALRMSINAQTIYEAYQETQPFVTDNNTQDRARARAWAMLHVRIDPEPVKAALTKIYSDGFLLGLDASKEAIAEQEKIYEKSAINKAEDSDYIDWANWKPGNRAASLLYRPTGAFKTLLDNAGIVSKAIAKVGYDRIGTALADSIAAGFSPARAARVLTEKIGDPARALTIAITEQNRAMSLAAMQNYKEYGVEKVEWSGALPCDICAPNEGQVVALGEDFNSGDTEPPVHPNCRCAVLPVINEEFYEEPVEGGMDLLPPLEGAAPQEQLQEATPVEEAKFLTNRQYNTLGKQQDTELGELSREDSRALHSYKGADYMRINGYLRKDEKWQKFGIDEIENARVKAIFDDRIDRVQGVIERTTPLAQPIITYRGVTGTFAQNLWESAPGSVFEDKGFVSTTTSAAKAKEFGGKTRLHVVVPAGTKALAIEGVIDVSSTLKEYEILLSKDTQFEIVSKEEKYTQEAHLRIITVKVVQP